MFPIQRTWAYDWSIQRPNQNVVYDNKRIEGANTDGKASVGLGIQICKYEENGNVWPFENADGFTVKTVVSGNTRRILEYTLSSSSYCWHSDLSNQLTPGDDAVEWVDAWGWYGIKFRFYGGVGDAEYAGVWVSSNGVLFFDAPCTDRYYSPAIPDKTDPDSFVAPFWRDLKPNQGGSVTYGIVQHPPDNPARCLAISWNNVPDIHGHPPPFQVIIEPAHMKTYHDPGNYWQSRIWFQYQSVTLDDPTTIGIEDQLGERGNSYNYLNLNSNTAFELSSYGSYAVITGLFIEIVENDAYSHVFIVKHENATRGVNVYLKPDPGEGDSEMQYLIALAGTATLLLELAPDPSGITKLAGFIVGSTLVVIEVADVLAASAKKAGAEIQDNKPNGVANFARVLGYEPNYRSFPVDAFFGIVFYWVFTDLNNIDHTLTVRTSVQYEEYSKYGTFIGRANVTTSKTLRVYIPGGGGGGGMFCPTLFSWNGRAYAEEGLLNIHGDSDVTIDYRLSHLTPVGRRCLLSLRELDNYTSHIDQARLFAVDAQDNWYECALRLAWHNNLGRVEALLTHNDEQRVDMAPGERTELIFLLPKNANNIHHFVFELNGHNPKGLR